MNNKTLFEVVATAIILKEPFKVGEKPVYLICQRASHEKTFPDKWTVPGGKLSTDDYTSTPKQTEHYWYGMIETALRREILEEVNLEIKNFWYLTSLARVKDDGCGNVVISFVADYSSGKVKLCDDMRDYAWVTFEELDNYDLIDGIVDELHMVERYAKGERDVEWERLA
jgi:8-oxo-dGTP pyrophosphatase MutT (NUDIX family)